MTDDKQLPFVWELERDGVTSYAIGTMHYSDINYRSALDDLLQNADQLLVELNPLALTDEDKQKLVALGPILQAHTYKDMLSFLTPQERRELATTNQLTESELEEATLSSILTKGLAGAGLKPEYSLDNQLIASAFRQDKPIIGLETTDEQVATFTTMTSTSPEETAAGFRRALAAHKELDPHNQYTFLQLQTKLYNEGSSQLSDKLGVSWTPVLYDFMTNTRNALMAERSLPHLDKPSIVAVGVGHFLCEPTMLSMYKEKGINVKRV